MLCYQYPEGYLEGQAEKEKEKEKALGTEESKSGGSDEDPTPKKRGRKRKAECRFKDFFLHFFHFIHLIIPFGKLGPSDLGTATAAARAALPSPASACWVFSCFHIPPKSDMDYRSSRPVL